MRFPTMSRGALARPILPLIVEGAGGQRLIVDALIDTGADLTLFPIDVAVALGIDLTGLPQIPVGSALGQQLSYARSRFGTSIATGRVSLARDRRHPVAVDDIRYSRHTRVFRAFSFALRLERSACRD